MTLTKEIVPSQAVKSKCNERPNEINEDSDGYQHILKTVENSGISNKPVARMEDGNIAIVDGWHRVKAAEEAGLDKITINLEEDMDDMEAMKKSLYGNMEEARAEVDIRDRALQLKKIWEAEGNEGLPSSTQLGEMVGVSTSTISKWLEPLRTEWEGTVFDPRAESFTNVLSAEEIQEIGIRKIRSIRKTTDGGEEGEWLAQQTVERNFTTQDLSDIRKYVNDGVEIEDAVKVVDDDLSEDDIGFESDEKEEREVTTTPTPESPTEPTVGENNQEERKTSTAELSSSQGSWTDDLESADDTQEEGDADDSWATVEDEEEELELVEDTQEEGDNGREPWPPENAKELSEQHRGWSDMSREIDEEMRNEDGGMEITIQLSERQTDAMEKVLEGNFDTPQKVILFALQFLFEEGQWME